LKFKQTYFVIDPQLRILWVGGEWDEFSFDNEGPEARAAAVLSSRVDQHIAGKETREAIASLISTVRESQHELKLDYRCDSPKMLRRYQLTVQPMKEGRVLMVHDLRDAEVFARPHGVFHYNPDAKAEKCSFCCSVREGQGAWVPAEDLTTHPREVAYRICPTCQANIAESIAASRNKRKAGRPVVNGFGPMRVEKD
jgi:hypothetical protein